MFATQSNGYLLLVTTTTLTPIDSRLLGAHVAWMRLRNLSPATIYQRQRMVSRFAASVQTPLLEVTEVELDAWQRTLMCLALRSRLAAISNITSFYGWAVEWEHIAGPSPTRILIRPKRPRGLPHPITEDDLATAISCAPKRLRAMLILASYAGLRVGEIARLDREDVRECDDPPILVVHGKGGKVRIVPMSDLVRTELMAHGLSGRGPVFPRCDGKGGQCEPWTISHLCGNYLHSLGITESAHSLRHRFGTRMYAATKDLRLTQELMGHDSPLTTAGYVAYGAQGAVDAVRLLAGEQVTDRRSLSCSRSRLAASCASAHLTASATVETSIPPLL